MRFYNLMSWCSPNINKKGQANMEKEEYSYRGARALVLLHEEHINSFWEIWQQAKTKGVLLPETSDPDYESMETLLVHVLRSAGGYMRWICQKLELGDPQIGQVPTADKIEKEAEKYMEHLFERWRIQLISIKEEKFFGEVYKSNWGVDYCIEAMLEHAVMHPIRHEFQLKELIV